MKAPKTENICVPTVDRPLDYGAVNELLKEKYGNVRGEQSYQSLCDNPGKGVHFVIGTKIVAEKQAMMYDLGKSGSPDNHHYQGLYKLWINR